MNISYLKEFIVLSSKETYQEAANHLYMTQSTLSKHIQTLSDELGSVLIKSEGRKIHLTLFGKEFLPIAIKISDLYDMGISIAEKHHHVNKLVIGTDLSENTWITKILPDFKAMYPNLDIECLCTEYSALENMLRYNKVSLVCFNSIYESVPGEFKATVYEFDSLYALLPAGHALAGRTQLSLNELKNDTFIEKPKYSSSYKILMELGKIAHFKPQITIYINRRSAQLDLVSQGMGVAIVEKCALDKMNLDAKQVIAIKLAPPNSLYSVFMMLKNNESEHCRHFLEYINEYFTSDQAAAQMLFSPNQFCS